MTVSLTMRGVLFAALLCATAQATSVPGSTPVDQGYRQMYNLDFDGAHRSFEQWQQDGSHDAIWRATRRWQSLLAGYEMPPLEVAIDEALQDFIARRKASMPDAIF